MSIRDCACCGAEFESTGHGRKYCDKCRAMSQSARERLVYRRELAEMAEQSGTRKKKKVMPLRPFVCAICGKEGMGKGNKYCPDCAEIATRQNMEARYEARKVKRRKARKQAEEAMEKAHSRISLEEARLLDYHDLSGKSADRVSAEALALGFGSSYGKYVACVQSGQIDRWLQDKGITDPVERLRAIKVK